jgi:glycosyltransferase involved in cell wall biosynthesis
VPQHGLFSYVANLWAHKGHRHLIDALGMLPTESAIRLLLVGDGPERERLEKQAERVGIRERVRFLGYRTDAWQHADEMFAYVHPSLREGLGQAVMEAMMRGLPVIASAAGGIPDLVTHERTGLLVPPGDAKALAEGMMRLTDNPRDANRLARAAREHALRSFDMERFLDAHYELYSRLARRG